MERASLAAELSSRRFELVAELESGGGWGGPADDVRGGLEVVVDDFAAAVALGSAGLLDRSFSWWKIRVRSLGGDPDVVEQLPRRFAAAMLERAPGCLQPDALTLLEHAAAYVRHAPDVARTGAALHPELVDGGLAHELVQALLGGDRITVGRLVDDERRSPSQLLAAGFEPALREIGARWQNGKMAPSVEHVASRLAHEFIGRAGRRVPAPPPDAPLVAMLRVEGDDHSLGQDCLRVHFAAAGLRARPFSAEPGRDVLLDQLVCSGAAAMAVSCMLPAQLLRVRDVIRWLRSAPALATLPVLVGGGMFADVPQLATQLGADGTAVDGSSAAEELAHALLGTAAGAAR
jgi:methanogenic corrinoid protein MtbC1